MSKRRRHCAGTEKVAILKRHLLDRVRNSDLCDEHDLYPSQFYAWLKEFFENGYAPFHNGRKSKAVEDAKGQRSEKLEGKLQCKDSVLAELMGEHVHLKIKGRLQKPNRPLRFREIKFLLRKSNLDSRVHCDPFLLRF
jgi:transposase